jgi:hypothetical protein
VLPDEKIIESKPPECVRLDRKATSISLLVVLGVRQDGQKVLLAIKHEGASYCP